ncbi:MAG: UvrB/UvrC motif-containing protein, partial [Spirochaetia bacterium]|nr:UvrB/UvrC motif-containing protein [Spirochaetia bacterium]
ALDNRPLFLEEFLKKSGRIVFVSATPGPFELENSENIPELINRPTGLVDPVIEIRPTEGQIDDLLSEIRKKVSEGFRVLVTTLTKKMSEDLTEYLKDKGVKVAYLHSDIETIERVEIIKSLRQGVVDVLVGINLLREGLDLPEVALVAILDADKIGFLRSKTSLIQTVGRAARNVKGRVIMYADKTTDAMRGCIDETNRRREIQVAYNTKHGIEPRTIIKAVEDILVRDLAGAKDKEISTHIEIPKNKAEANDLIKKLDFEMKLAADQLDFEKAIRIREQIKKITTGLKIA